MKITEQDVCELIREKLGRRLEGAATLDQNSVFDSLGLSSLQLADIVYSIEDRLGVEFDPADAADVRTVGDLVRLANLTAEKQGGAGSESVASRAGL